jgi:D-threo-aldose 1-dehydrogenase
VARSTGGEVDVAPRIAQRARLGRTRLEVTRLGLGCAPLGNLFAAVADDEAHAVVAAAWDAGVRFFDTAPLYGHGLSEIRLGRALTDRPRHEYVIATKVGRVLVPDPTPPDVGFVDVPPFSPRFDFSYDATLRSLEESLVRLGLGRVDVLHVHDPDDHLEQAIQGACRALVRLRDEGVVGAIGAGMNAAAPLARLVRAVDLDCVLVAGRYTLLEQPALDELLPLCEERGVAVIAAGVFNSGVLAAAGGGTYDYAPAPPAVLARARALRAACERAGVAVETAALQLPLAHPAVACVLTGTRSVDEMRRNAAGFERPIEPGLWRSLRDGGLLDARVPTPGAEGA